MAKLTDYVREGFQRRRRPWDRVELPEWWDLMVWAGVAAVVAMLVFGALLGPDGSDSSSGVTVTPPPYAVQTLNPKGSTPAPGRSATPTASPVGPPEGGGTGGSGTDFGATAPTQVPVTAGTGTTVVPVGARNVAMAAAKAEATGDWTGIPCLGPCPVVKHRTPEGSVSGEITVADPAVTGNSQYVFSATIAHGGAGRRYLVRIAVERGRSGYAVRPR